MFSKYSEYIHNLSNYTWLKDINIFLYNFNMSMVICIFKLEIGVYILLFSNKCIAIIDFNKNSLKIDDLDIHFDYEYELITNIYNYISKYNNKYYEEFDEYYELFSKKYIIVNKKYIENIIGKPDIIEI